MLITKENCPARWSAAAERLIDGRKSELEMLHSVDQEVYTQVYNLDTDNDSIPIPIVKMLSADATGATFSVSPEGIWKAGYTIKTWDGTEPVAPTLSEYTPGSEIAYAGEPGKHVVIAFTVEDLNGVSDPVSFTKIYAPAVPTGLVVSDTGIVTFTSEGGNALIEYTVNGGESIVVAENSGYVLPDTVSEDIVRVRVRATNPGGSSDWTSVIEQVIA